LKYAVLESRVLRYTALTEPKAGSSKSEYEDAWSVSGRRPSARGALAERCTFALTDGASESMLAGAWAGRLARAVGGLAGQDLDAEAFAERICAAAARWPAYVSRYVRGRARIGRPIAWYEESKLEQGAYATLLAVSFRGGPEGKSGSSDARGGGTWSAAALGDACGFHVRDARLAAAFPVQASADFDTSPHLAGTRAPDRKLLEARTVVRQGTWLPGDVFYLATDAAAQWFLAEVEAGRQPWRAIDEVCDADTPDSTSNWLEKLRAERSMRNDDVTIVRCRFDQGAEH
jgi:hypothetical protein